MSQIAFDKNGTAQLYVYASIGCNFACYLRNVCALCRWRDIDLKYVCMSGSRRRRSNKNKKTTLANFFVKQEIKNLHWAKMGKEQTFFLLCFQSPHLCVWCASKQRGKKHYEHDENEGNGRWEPEVGRHRANGSDAHTISCSKEFSQATSTAKIDKGEIFVFICHKFVFVQLVISLKWNWY